MASRLVYPIVIGVLVLAVLALAFVNFGKNWFKVGEEKTVSYHDIVLEKVEKMGKLELVKYSFRDVMEHKIEYDYWWDSKAILIISGEAIGCIDLEKVSSEDIVETEDTMYVRLPEPELCNYKINHQGSRIYDTKSYSMDKTKLIGEAFKEAEKQIKRTALQSDILAQARRNGEQILRPLFQELSGKVVRFSYAPASTGESFPKE